MPERPAPTMRTSRRSGSAGSAPPPGVWVKVSGGKALSSVVDPAVARSGGLQHPEGYPGVLQSCEKHVTHRCNGRQLAGALGKVVEGEAEAALGEELGRLRVPRVAARDLGDDASAAAFADEADLEPAARAGRRARSLAWGFRLQQQLA